MTDFEKHMITEAEEDLKLALKVPRWVSKMMIREALEKLDFVARRVD